MERTYWQIAAGNSTQGRDYSDLFLRYGMAFVGGDKQVALMSEVNVGDIVILKMGLLKIRASGTVVTREGSSGGVADKQWVRDVEGWDLKAYRFVEWHLPEAIVETDGLTRSTINRCHYAEHKRIADEILEGPAIGPAAEPYEQEVIDPGDMAARLATEGNAVDQAAFRARVEKYQVLYREHFGQAMKLNGEGIRKQVLRPLLASLGWTDQQLSDNIRGRRLGHVLTAFHGADNVLPIVCRPWYHGVDLHDDQASACAMRFPSAKGLVVTNGIAYKLYTRSEQGYTFDTVPAAYCNIAHLTERCSSDPSVPGAPTLLSFLLPHSR